MKTLLEDYKSKLKSISEMIDQVLKYDGMSMRISESIRLKQKRAEYRAFIVDIERAIERSKEPVDEFGHHTNWKYCPGCGISWEKDFDSFGCSSCGFIK